MANLKAELWFAKLGKLLSEMPEDVEVLFQEYGVDSATGCSSSFVYLFEAGALAERGYGGDDLMSVDVEKGADASFNVSRVSANNHGY